MPDYSSDLDPMSSPVKGGGEKRSRAENENGDDDGSITPTRRRLKRPKTVGGGAAARRVHKSELRTTRYDCIAVIRTKVVFGKRWVSVLRKRRVAFSRYGDRLTHQVRETGRNPW
jgi:hypothetical protein